jgi:PKD repeat protein
MNKNPLDRFEQFLQDAANEHIEPLDMQPWEAIEKKLPKGHAGIFKSPWLWGAATILAIALPMSYWYFTNNQDHTPLQLVDTTSNENVSNSTSNSLNSSENMLTNSNNEYSNAPVETTDASSTANESKMVGNLSEPKIEQPVKEAISETKTTTTTQLTEPKGDQLPTAVNTPQGSGQNGGLFVEIPTPLATYTASAYHACEGETVTFTAKKQDNVDYLWSFGDGSYSKDRVAKHTFTASGTYTVNLIVQSKLDKNVVAKSDDESFTIHPSPIISFDVILKDENGIPYAAFVNRTDRAIKWTWQTGDGETLTEKEPNYTYHHRGNYPVTLTAENEFGCKKALTQPVAITEDYNLLAPNSFTPNGDGINDYFIPVALTIMDVEFVMTIISPTEGIIFESKSISRPWDGSNHKTGSLCGEGAYKWVVSYVNKYGKTEQFTGVVLLLK